MHAPGQSLTVIAPPLAGAASPQAPPEDDSTGPGLLTTLHKPHGGEARGNTRQCQCGKKGEKSYKKEYA